MRTIYTDKPKIDLADHTDTLRATVTENEGWLWDYRGMVKTLSPEVLVEALRLYENATMNLHSRVRAPDRARYIYWNPTREARTNARLPRLP